MKLTVVEIEGFRSIRKKAVLNVEPNVTVVLGPNDHGKTNLIDALQFLNKEKTFIEDVDLNWDLYDKGVAFPHLRFTFRLTVEEREALRDLENKTRDSLTPPTPVATEAKTDTEATLSPSAIRTLLDDVPVEAAFYRRGVASALMFEPWEGFSEVVTAKLQSFIPRVELFKPSDKIVDTVTAAQIADGQNDFMRGIFFYGGLHPDTSAKFFEQGDRTVQRLDDASQQLEATLKESWSQGQDLGFILRHNSKNSTIELSMKDPAVKGRKVRASQRSSGFTAFFAIKTILHARQQTHPASSYIYLFDEPGLYLHPSGQFDLLQVLETLGTQDQVLYVTHSLFLINKSHPTRHRLISKTEEGTVINGKPYVGRWGVVLSALGLSLSGTILFANEVLLTEGDSDPIYIQACFQKLIAKKKLFVEINGFSAMGTGDGQNAQVMLWTLSESNPVPRIMMLFDGDPAGKELESEIRPLLSNLGGSPHLLEDGLAIEDYLIGGDDTYVRAVVAYYRKLMKDKGVTVEAGAEASALEDLKKWRTKPENTSVAKWCEQYVKTLATLKSSLSKVGIAREYVSLLFELDFDALDPKDYERCISLLSKIADDLKLPPQAPPPYKVFES